MERLSDYQKLYNLELAYLKQYERANGQALECAADTIVKLECYQDQVIRQVYKIATALGLKTDGLLHPTDNVKTSLECLREIAVAVRGQLEDIERLEKVVNRLTAIKKAARDLLNLLPPLPFPPPFDSAEIGNAVLELEDALEE